MFSLIYGFVEYALRKDEFHVLILGIDKAGKTNLLERLKTLFTDAMGMDPSKIMSTVGLNVGRMEAHSCNLIFWDLGGAPGLRSLWDKYYDETHGVIFVIDSSNHERFDEAKAALDKVCGSPGRRRLNKCMGGRRAAACCPRCAVMLPASRLSGIHAW
jgi:ADP-ribosylation factor related protein 1